MENPQVICFGEVLWDLLPAGKIAGGAPMNVAFQLNQLGVLVSMVSRIGRDALGAELKQFLSNKNISVGMVQEDPHYPTGTVKVELDAVGHPNYEIVQQVAWDFIEAEDAVIQALKQSSAFVFGSLAARTETSKNTLQTLIQHASFRVLDVNLRAPFYSKSLLDELLPLADFVKMNDAELDQIAAWYGFEGAMQEKMTAIKSTNNLQILVVTRGEAGAIVLDDTGFYNHSGYSVQVQDTIGSGDAFLAGFLSQYLLQKPPAFCLDFACKMGAFVATKRGGTPELNLSELDAIEPKGL